MTFTYAVFTDKGDRKVNEDSVGAVSDGSKCCFILCDGLGGHGMGDEASQLVVDVFKNQFNKSDDCGSFLTQSFLAAQDILLAQQGLKNARKKMKTTAVCVLADDKNAYIGHIGDSRLYAFSGNEVSFRTLDHSVPQMMVMSKEIKEEEIRNHPDRSMLLKVLGTEWSTSQFELRKPVPLKKIQAFLLCSDGFWELIEEKTMCELLEKAGSAEEWLRNMLRVVKKNGQGRNMDNYSAIAVWKS